MNLPAALATVRRETLRPVCTVTVTRSPARNCVPRTTRFGAPEVWSRACLRADWSAAALEGTSSTRIAAAIRLARITGNSMPSTCLDHTHIHCHICKRIADRPIVAAGGRKGRV